MTTPAQLKIDKRPTRGMWAPGNYMCRCVSCKDFYQGDKRSIECADCAYSKSAVDLKKQFDPRKDIGTAAEAISYAIDGIDDHYDRLEFLTMWRDGSIRDCDDFDEYQKWLEQYRRTGK